MKLARKINVKSVCGSQSEIAKKATEAGTPIMDVWGRAMSVDQRQSLSRTGEPEEYFFLRGDFRARPSGSEDTVAAPVLSLPEYAMLPARNALESDAQMVEMAYRCLAVLDDASPIGWRIEVQPLIEDQQTDPLMALEKRMNKALK